VTGVPGKLSDRLSQSGYRVVHGVEFGAPEDVLDLVPEIGDLTRRQLQKANLSQWFGRQAPEYIRKEKTKVLTSSLWSNLTQGQKRGEQVVGNFGPAATLDNGDLKRVVDDLHEILYDEVQRPTTEALENARKTRGPVGRAGARWSAMLTPMSVESLASDIGYKRFSSLLKARGYSDDEVRAIYKSVQSAKKLGFKDQGLFSIEAHLRANPVLLDGLRLMSRHQIADSYVKKAAGTSFTFGGTMGGGLLASAEVSQRDPEAGIAERALAFGVGAAAGRMGSSLINRKLLGAMPKGTGLISKGADAWERSRYLHWAYLPDKLATIRDYVRFSLSPVFDASRYTESMILGQLEGTAEGLRLPVNLSPSNFRRTVAKEAKLAGASADSAARQAESEWARVSDEFAHAARGDFEWETIDGLSRRFSSIGILGFSPANWMAATFAHLRRQGVDGQKAYKMVRDVYTYGTTGRSAAELSMNFVFFPFSFTKKTVKHMSRFFNQDLSRLIITQDMMATYNLLNEEYNLSEMWRERLPILDRLRRLNLLAYGVGLGQFGGVNAPLLAAAREVPGLGSLYVGPQIDTIASATGMEIDPILNLFIPQSVSMRNAEDASAIEELVRRAVPAWNDVQSLVDDLGEQGKVVFSQTHMTTSAEVNRAYTEWREYQDTWKPFMITQDRSWDSLMADPVYSAIIKQKRAEIQDKYPAWREARAQAVENQTLIDMEKGERLANPGDPGDDQLVKFEFVLKQQKSALEEQNVSLIGDYADPLAQDRMRAVAIQLVGENPQFLRLYNKFYRSDFGDISREVK